MYAVTKRHKNNFFEIPIRNVRILKIHINMYFFIWFVVLIISVPCQALRLNMPNEGAVIYEDLVVDENGETSVRDKNNKTKTPSVGTGTFKIAKYEEESPEDIRMAQNGVKLEDLISMRDQIEHIIMKEIHKRINSNGKSEIDDNYSHIELQPDDIIPEDKLKSLGHKL